MRGLRTSDGVLVQVAECDIFDEMMEAITGELVQRGVAGLFDLYDGETAVTPPTGVPVVLCRLRLAGERIALDRGYRWVPAPGAVDAILLAVEAWCRRLGPRAAYALRKGAAAPVPLSFDGDAAGGLREGVDDNQNTSISAVAGVRHRSVGVGAVGGVGMVVGGLDFDEGEWADAVAELTGFSREHADALAFARAGFVDEPAL